MPQTQWRTVLRRLSWMAPVVLVALMAVVSMATIALAAGPMSRSQALQALDHRSAPERAVALARLADVGRMVDAAQVAERLRDADEGVRELAASVLWAIWSRSGDRTVDAWMAEGLAQMNQGELDAALVTFDRVVARQPAFAEGWNRRATVRFLLGQDEASLKDCEEVLKRNPLHFGALAGMAQIHARRGDPERALHTYERALQVNPNLADAPQVLQLLQEAARRQGLSRT
jgi:tetratricopeptide (TPR) repeat protein